MDTYPLLVHASIDEYISQLMGIEMPTRLIDEVSQLMGIELPT
jgi:hypothetical protein